MEKMIFYFGHIPSWQRSLILVGGLLVFWILEGIIPLIRLPYRKIRHAGLNLFFTLTTVLINFGFAGLIVFSSHYCSVHKLGLLYLFPLPMWLFALAGILLLDFIGAWLIHWIEHQVRWMWRFHLIHHTDTWVDATTANRHHPVESVFRAVFTLLAVLVSGAPLWLVFLYQSLSVLFAQFNHANIVLPGWLDRILGRVIVTPDMHKVHHHYIQPLTDTNYGNIFSWWDRLFRTYATVKDTRSLRYGIDSCMKETENSRVGRLLKIPFLHYRPPAGAKFNNPDA
ncbi:MAG: sterol desaturase family protein [Puia sp.]|nr:sterol desaturase family protein [Puia sp.]